MKESLRLELIKRIKSGDYTHGTGANKRLVRAGYVEHCVLGIILEIYLDEFPDKGYKWKAVSDHKGGLGEYRLITDKGAYSPTSSLSTKIQTWAEMEEGEQFTLYHINDMEKTLTFGKRKGYSSVLKFLTKTGGD